MRGLNGILQWNTIVKDIKDLPRKINEAFLIATSGRPGPVLVDLPKDARYLHCANLILISNFR